MASAPRVNKRVFPIRRAPDGSAFHKCGACGVSIAIALADMHYCESKMEVKRFKGTVGMLSLPKKKSTINQESTRVALPSFYGKFHEGSWDGKLC